MTFEEFKKTDTPVQSNDPILSEKSIDDHFVNLLLFQAQLKIMHWGTESYAQHNAYGMTYSSIDEGLDTLVESYQGYHGRINFGSSCEFINFSSVDNNSWLASMLECLITLRGYFKESDLQNMTDELIGSVSKLKYLLSLK